MSSAGTERLIERLEKALMIHLHSMGASHCDIGKTLSKRKSDVNNFLKPIAKGKR